MGEEPGAPDGAALAAPRSLAPPDALHAAAGRLWGKSGHVLWVDSFDDWMEMLDDDQGCEHCTRLATELSTLGVSLYDCGFAFTTANTDTADEMRDYCADCLNAGWSQP